MLGRQQIAGIPTAISELFKNAHDAYADNVIVDYYRSDGLFVLRDDGLGMTRQDFENKWLTLGTESKIDINNGLSALPIDPDKPIRPILGEKGIGRLAIASIGPQVLVMTRAKRGLELDDLIVSFINWELFALPGIDLNDIEIPIRVFPGGTLPEKNDIKKMIEEVIKNVKSLEITGKVTNEDAVRITSQINTFSIDLIDIYGYLGKPVLTEESHGTHFIILPAYELLQTAIDGDKNDQFGRASPLLKSLIGFTNTMVSGKNNVIMACFRDHKTDEICDDLINDNVFFTPEEFNSADHHFQGIFDAYGQFNGTVTVYGENTVEHKIPWNGGYGRKTLCGPFKINVAYVQGSKDQTKLPPDEHALMMTKLKMLGGLYIYRDGIRILPYGDSDYDFLDIERRRTLKASYYYFSYRRMIGFIDITRAENYTLKEKAGREGFIGDKAYRQFKNILEDFFMQLAADFFREESPGQKTDFFLLRRQQLMEQYRAKEEAEKKATIKKAKFQKDLETFFESVKNGEPEKDIQKLIELIERELDIALKKQDLDELIQAFIDTESSTRKQLEEIRNKYKVVKPRGFVPGKLLQHDFESYQSEISRLETEIFSPATDKINKIINDAAYEHNILIDKRRRLQRSLTDVINNAKNTTRSKTSETKKIAEDVENIVIKLTKDILIETEDEINNVMSEFAKLDVSNLDDSTIASKKIALETPIVDKVEKNKDVLESIQEQLKDIVTRNEDGKAVPSSIEITAAYEDELLALKEKAEMDLELTQLGMAVGVIHHEFTGTVKSIRENIRRLKAWADVNENLNPIYQNIRANFEHLDGYLNLFTPLNKRLYRKEVEITGYTIKQFLDDIFAERMRRHNITLKSTENFDKKTIIGYPSSFYPVFVNVVDNAIFWLKDKQISRQILLDADENGYFISNNGPEIPERDYNIIFEMGFTRKPNGIGLGLYISKQVLKKVGYDIFVTTPRPEMNVTFRIESIIEKEINDGV